MGGGAKVNGEFGQFVTAVIREVDEGAEVLPNPMFAADTSLFSMVHFRKWLMIADAAVLGTAMLRIEAEAERCGLVVSLMRGRERVKCQGERPLAPTQPDAKTGYQPVTPTTER